MKLETILTKPAMDKVMPRKRAAAWGKVIPDSFTPNKIDCGEFLLWSYMRPIGHSKSAAVRGGYAPLAREWAYALKDKSGTFFNVSEAVNGFASKEQAEHHARYHSPAGKLEAEKIHARSMGK